MDKSHVLTAPDQSLFNSLFSNSPQPIAIYNFIEECFIDINSAFKELFGYSDKETKNINRFDLIGWDHTRVKKIKSQVNKILKDQVKIIVAGKSFEDTGIFITKNGEYLYCKTKVSPTNRNKGEAFIIISNNTNYVQKAYSLKKVKDSYQKLLDYTPYAIIEVDINGNFISFSNMAEEYYNISREDVQDKKIIDFVSSADKKKLIDKYANTISSSNGFVEEYYAQRSDGSEFYCQCVCRHIRDSNGRTTSSIFYVKDQTFELSMQETMIKQQNFLNAVIESSADEIVVLNLDDEVVLYNQKAKNNISGYTSIKIEENKMLFENFESEFSQHIIGKIQATRQGATDNLEHSFINHKTGEEVYFSLNFSPIKDEKGAIIGTILTSKNITEIKKNEAILTAVLNSAPDSMWAIDRNYNLLCHNTKCKEEFEAIDDRIKIVPGMNFSTDIPSEYFESWNERIFQPVFEGKAFKTTVSHSIGDQKISAQNHYAPVKDSNGAIIGCLEIARNVTSIVEAQEKLSLKNGQLNAVFNSVPDTILVIDKEHKIISANEVAIHYLKRLVGYTKAVGDDLLKDLPAYLIQFIEYLTDQIHKGESFRKEFEFRFEDKDAPLMYLDFQSLPAFDENKNVFGMVLVIRDITDETVQSIKLKKSTNEYKTYFNNSQQGITIVNYIDRVMIKANHRILELFNIKKTVNLNNLVLSDFLHKNQFDGLSSAEFIVTIKQELQNKNIFKSDFIGLKLKGEKISSESFIGNITIVKEKDSKYMTLFVSDISKEYYAKAEVEEKKAIYQSLMDNSFDGIDIIELMKSSNKKSKITGELLYRNEKMKQLFDNSESPLLNAKEFLAFSPELQNSRIKSKVLYDKHTKELLEAGKIKHEWQLIQNDKIRDIIIANQIIKVNDKTLKIRVCQDITDIKTQENTIKQQLNMLDEKTKQLELYIESNLQLENFAYIASHDLKAPLRTISSFSFLLKKNAWELLDTKSQKFLDIVIKSSTNMQMLIDDLLEFSRVNTRKVDLATANMDELFQQVLSDNQTLIKQAKAKIEFQSYPTEILIDKIKVIQLFQNLILNAIKFTREGIIPEVVISGKETNDHWQFSVKDNGIGLKKENYNKVFQIFTKLHSNDVFSGTGLGLTICRKIVEQHNGKIWVESDLGKGCNFFFTIAKKEISVK